MSNSDPFGTYLRELQKNLSTGVASEHTHRSALEALLEATGFGDRSLWLLDRAKRPCHWPKPCALKSYTGP